MRPGMAAAIDFARKHENCPTMEAAVDFVIGKARIAIASGERVDRFWFSGQKWREQKGAANGTQASKDPGAYRTGNYERFNKKPDIVVS